MQMIFQPCLTVASSPACARTNHDPEYSGRAEVVHRADYRLAIALVATHFRSWAGLPSSKTYLDLISGSVSENAFGFGVRDVYFLSTLFYIVGTCSWFQPFGQRSLFSGPRTVHLRVNNWFVLLLTSWESIRLIPSLLPLWWADRQETSVNRMYF